MLTWTTGFIHLKDDDFPIDFKGVGLRPHFRN